MPDVLECGNCGAVLLESDLFCGECGAPRSAMAPLPAPSASEHVSTGSAAVPPAVLPSAAAEPARPRSAVGLWRIAVISLGLLSVLLCVAGLAVFLLVGLAESDVTSPQDNWIYSTLCCLVPIAGPGVLVGLAALGIWFARLRKR